MSVNPQKEEVRVVVCVSVSLFCCMCVVTTNFN